MTQQELELPKGWAESEFKKTVKSIPLTGKKLKQKEYLQSGKFPVIDQGQDFIGGFTDKKELVVECKLPIIVFGDHTKAVKFVNQNFVVGADGVKVLEPNPIFNPKLLYYFIQAMPLPNKGYARHYQYLEKSMIKIPPSNEQKRIVSKMEELFSKIDSTKQSLEHTKLQLEQYRQSLLRSKFWGKHTEKWKQCKLDDISDIVRGASPRPAHSPKYFGGKIPWITVGTLTSEPSPYFTKTTEFLNEEGKKKSRYILSDTLLITNSGATLGVPKISKINGCINDGVVALLKIDYPLKKFLYYFLTSKTKELRLIKQGAAQPNLNTTIIKNIEFRLPPLNEQEQIVSQIEQGFSLIENSQRIVNSTLQTLETMRISVLKQAFEGKLVTQDPNDEPAEILLEKIKKEK